MITIIVFTLFVLFAYNILLIFYTRTSSIIYLNSFSTVIWITLISI